MKVRMFGDWNQDCYQMLDNLALFTAGLEGRRFGNVEFVNDDSYDAACVFNFPLEPLVTPPEKNFGLLLEPPEILAHMYPSWVGATEVPGVDRYYAFCTGTAFVPALGLGFASVEPTETPPDGRSRACIIASQKRFTPWHAKRHEVLEALLRSGLQIDVYGRGRPTDPNDPRLKGEIPPGGKQGVLRGYQYVIDFENSPESVVTDKFFDAVLSGCVPITNSSLVPSLMESQHGYRFVDFASSPSTIVDSIANFISAPPNNLDELAVSGSRGCITSGKMNLVRWIHDRAIEVSHAE